MSQINPVDLPQACGANNQWAARSLALLCFVLCIPSGGALLTKVYGIASMQWVTFVIFVPCCVVLFAICRSARRSGNAGLADALTIGFIGGLLGTIGYDLIRIPFVISGQRVFAPISAYGIWILEAATANRLTEVVGWTYHFSNGITFGIMYALFMRNRHWAWAILWAFVLETIAILSPFSSIFSLWGNSYAIGIAYLGHVAYGLPLGWLVYRWDGTRLYLAHLPLWLKIGCVMIVSTTVIGPLISPENVARDRRASQGEFRVEGRRLNPEWLRIGRGASIGVYNPEGRPVTVRVKQTDSTTGLPSGARETIQFSKTGVFQLFVESDRRSRSSFVIVEPVEELR